LFEPLFPIPVERGERCRRRFRGKNIFWEPALRQSRKLGKGKGCDIGYALAANSCEGANSVEACTVTALDAITVFAVPNPNCPSQSRRFFQVWLLFGLPRRADHSAYFGPAKVLIKPTLSAVDACHPKHLLQSCQCRISVQNLKFASAPTEEPIR
jgi:hypothetical protein